MTSFSKKVTDLSPKQRQLLELLLSKQGADVSESLILPRSRATDLAPLSFAQQRLWFLHQLEPDSPAYNIPTALRLRGPLNVAALQTALTALVERHESLRTTFAARDGKPFQRIAPATSVLLEAVDLTRLPETERESAVRQQVIDESLRPFDLSSGPLIRSALFRLAEVEHVLLITLHHIIADGWSMGILVRELTALYLASISGTVASLPDLPIQYADYALWQQERLPGEALDAHLAYWRGQLQDSPTALSLPTDRPRPPVQTFEGAVEPFELSPALTESLKDLSQRAGLTLFITLLAAFQILLARYTGEDDIVVGSPTSGRSRAEIEGLIGFFVNTLVLRTDLREAGNPTFREALGRVREVVRAAQAHQALPFERLVEALQPERDLSRQPLFQVLFVFQNTPMGSLELPQLSLAPFDIEKGLSAFDVTLQLGEAGNQLVGYLEYSTDLFEAGTIQRLLGHFKTLLEGIVADPDQRLMDLPLMAEAERRQCVETWNATAAAYPDEQCVHQLFQAQAERSPEAIAVVFDDVVGAKHSTQQSLKQHLGTNASPLLHITYAELNRRAEQLARYLQTLGVKPDTVVGLCVERSPEMLIGVLGILKAGGAYLPLDPNYPAERLAYMLEDSGAQVLLTQARLLAAGENDERPLRETKDHFAGQITRHASRVTALCLDTDWPLISQSAISNQQSAISPDNLAYLIYTSGSTGQPKGVAMTHRPLANLIHWQLQNTVLPAGARTLQFASLSFDVSFQEIFSTWCSGGAVVLIPDEARRDPIELLRRLDTGAVERLFLPFVALQQIAEAAEARDLTPTHLREVITAGEQLRITPAIASLMGKLKNGRLHNQYGPSETHVVTAFSLDSSPGEWSALPPIGRPINNTQIYLLDSRLQPVPINVPGELYLGGVNLARGYLGRPDLTAEKFIPNPFLQKDEGGGMKDEEKRRDSFILHPSSLRLYKTGDLARYLPNGNIEFLGRLDHQVKVRGYRVELGEVEAALNEYPAVRETVVVARDDQAYGKRLVAYIVSAESPNAPSIEELRSFLKARLPDYLLPSAFVFLERLPLTPSGKVNRRALPAPDPAQRTVGETFVAPRTPAEELLAGIWAQVLKIERVGIHDNFFELGGHSLLATQLVSRVREVFGVELPVRAIFESPTVAGLVGAKQALPFATASPLRPIAHTSPLPLSFAQQRLWFLDRLEPGSAVYNIPIGIRLSGPLNLSALEHSLNTIVQRHEALRTTFEMNAGQPCQVIKSEQPIVLTCLSLAALPPPEREVEVQRLAREEAAQPFDLTRGPLLRATILDLAEDERVLLLTMHHIVSDGWSMNVLIREMAALYPAWATSESAESLLPPLPIQYADFAGWQREQLQGQILDEQLTYWKEHLSGIPALLQLPTDRPRPPIRTYRGASYSGRLPQSLSAALAQLSRREGVTLFMTLLAAFQVLLARYSGHASRDIVVGSPIANRNRAEIEGLIGFFVNTLVLRTDLSGQPTFRELLKRVREVTLGAYAHQDLPFEQLVEALQPERTMSHSPLFQVMLVLQNQPLATEAETWAGLTMEPLEIKSNVAKFDLTVTLLETPQGLSGRVEYSTDLFDPATIERLWSHFQTLLEGSVANPEQRLGTLPLLSEAERQRLVWEWNATEAADPQDRGVPELFEAQVERTPDAVAILFAGDDNSWPQHLTYQTLNQRANQLAHYLQTLGVGPEVLVGVCLERSLEMVVSLLAVLKAGGAYVPLDPAYPAERLAFMLADAGIEVLVTESRLLVAGDWGLGAGENDERPLRETKDRFAGQITSHESRVTALCLDTDWPLISQSAISIQQSAISPDSLAYLIYTSGSTGQPKGVMVAQRGVCNLVQAQIRAFEVQPESRVLQFASFSFDAAVSEVFVTLLAGATLCLAPREALLPGPPLMQWLRDQAITTVTLPPSALAVLDVEPLPALQTLIVAGEACPAELVARWKTGRRFLNAYGPTEASVCATVAECEADQRPPSIGRPILNTQIYILDSHLQPTPIGVPGELYIGGVGVGRGYLGRPDLTAERFVPNPFLQKDEGGRMKDEKEPEDSFTRSVHPSSFRLYKTGDLARYLPDGNIEYLGRVDHQVKIRGFRIELGEIEAVLTRHAGVREAVVLAREMDRGMGQRLVAYVVPTGDRFARRTTDDGRHADEARSNPLSTVHRPPSSVELRAFLKTQLPDYMLPAAFVFLEALPLTPNGKIDRRALSTLSLSKGEGPEPDEARPGLSATFVAPRSAAEEILAGIWTQVLTLNQVGVHDNFFELGGHSLLATQLISRIREAFRVEVPLRALFESPTIAGLAEHIAVGAKPALNFAPASPLRPIAHTSPLPLSFAQQRLWFLDQLEPNSAAYNIPLAMRLSGPLNPSALEHSLNAIVQRHEVLRTTFQMKAGQPQQIILPELTIQLTRMSLEDLAPPDRDLEARRLAREEALRPFNLTQGPLLRATLLALAEREQVLLLNLHHIVSDGWSMGVLINEVVTLYAAAIVGQSLALPELSIQYADFARWQRDWLQGAVLEEQLAYWKGQLAGAPALLDLPTDRPRPPVQTFSGAWLPFELSPTLSAELIALSQQTGVTLFMTLLAAFNVLLARYSGQDDIVIGSPIANRNRAEIEGLIGFFVNTLALRTRLTGDLSFRELVERVRETALGAYAHQDLPFELLVEHLQPKRDLSYSPVFQAMFNLENAPLGKLDVPDMTFQPLAFETQTAKYDLTLLMEQRGPQLFGVLEYNTDLFESRTIARLLGHFQQILENVVAQPDRCVTELSLLTESERGQLLVEWNATQGDYPAETCLHTLFEAQVERTPQAVAVMDAHQRLTYHELNERANLLAHYLQALGVGPEVPVGVCLERSAQTLVALLAILKAGGVYVPLDPGYPSEHLAFILADAGIEVLVTESRWLVAGRWGLVESAQVSGVQVSSGQLSAISYSPPAIVCLDTDWEKITTSNRQPLTINNQQPATNNQQPTADSLAFIVYTSGSTGQPKGVAVSQRQLLNRLAWMWQAYPFAADEVMCQRTTVNFSVSLWELLGALLQGAPTLIVGDEVIKDLPQLVATLAEHNVTRIVVVPSLLRVILETDIDLPATLPRLRLWSTCGEPLTVELYRRFKERLPQATLLNQYGASELNDAAWYDTHLQPVADSGLYVPIGRPILNTQLYVLDKQLQPVPVGIPGEVYVSSVGLARGYFKRPDLTAERFIPNLFLEKDEGGRMKDEKENEDSFRLHPSSFILYRTGDRARYLPNGVLEYVGRVDNQIKIRGMRVELKGVEAILNQHSAVRQAAVLAREAGSPGEKRLVAYVVMDSAETPFDELRNFLKTKLPDHMIPMVFVRLDALPLTPNGKVDRQALPMPDDARPDLGQTYIAPETDVERTVAAIWSEALKLERVGVQDNFFELGGHSLLIIQVHQRLQESFPQRTITVVDLFKFPTVRDQARYLEQTYDEGASLQKSLERVERRSAALQNRRNKKGRR